MDETLDLTLDRDLGEEENIKPKKLMEWIKREELEDFQNVLWQNRVYI